jgi:hypothetical protein
MAGDYPLQQVATVAVSPQPVGDPVMALRIDDQGQNVFPAVEAVDASDAGREVEVTLLTKVEDKLTPVVVKLSYKQASDLSKLLAIFGD